MPSDYCSSFHWAIYTAEEYYPRKYFHSDSLTAHHCFSSQYPPDTVRFSADGCLFGYTPDIHAPCGTIFHSRNQRKERRYYPFGTTDGYSCFACSKRHCRRIHGLAVYLLHCRGIDGRLFAYYNKDTPGPSFQLSGKLCRTDEILVFHRQEVSPTPHSFVACRFLVRIVPCHVELSGFQDGTGAFLCGKQYHRNVGTLWHSGALTASSIGRFINTVGVKRLTYIGCSLIISAWIVLYAGQYSYAGIIAGILLIDIGMQCIQLSNQTSAFALCPQASNRINTIS